MTLYDRTQLAYTSMEYLLDHHEDMGIDLNLFKEEIKDYQEKCALWVTLYEEAIYPQFARLLDTLMKIIHK
jgi:hypothetical protein